MSNEPKSPSQPAPRPDEDPRHTANPPVPKGDRSGAETPTSSPDKAIPLDDLTTGNDK